MYAAMIEFGIPEKLVRLTRMTMLHIRGAIRVEGDILREFDIRRGLKQEDGLSCILFNIVLEKAIRTANVVSRGTILNRSIQILDYANDLNIVGRSIPEVREAFFRIEAAAKKMDLVINEHKTKLMVSSVSTNLIKKIGQNITLGEYNFEVVKVYVYGDAGE